MQALGILRFIMVTNLHLEETTKFRQMHSSNLNESI